MKKPMPLMTWAFIDLNLVMGSQRELTIVDVDHYRAVWRDITSQ